MLCKSAAAAGVHFFFFNELAPVGLGDAFSDGGAKAGLFLKQAQGCVLHQSLGVGACVDGDLGKPGFLLGRETYFHAFKVRENRHSGKRRRSAVADPQRGAGEGVQLRQYS